MCSKRWKALSVPTVVNPLKRTIDFLGALLGLAILWPLFVVAAILVKWEDHGPVFFKQERVGKHGIPFTIFKFRTMTVNAEQMGSAITVGQDPRITRIGHGLRKFKLDEFPQLFNVIRGEMSLVGPRPEVQFFVDMYSEEQRRVLELLPGITDPASIKYRDESNLLAESADPLKTYCQEVMPDKILINLKYAAHATSWADIQLIFKTLRRLV